MRDVFSASKLEDIDLEVDIFVKAYSKCLMYFKRDPMPTFKNGKYYLDVEYELRDHQIMKGVQ